MTLVACTALLGGTAVIGLSGLGNQYRTAGEQYDELRTLYEVGHHAVTVRLLLQESSPRETLLRQRLMLAAKEAATLPNEPAAAR